jgi:hypothetical protein
VNDVQRSVQAATGQPFRVETACTRWGDNPTPGWVANAVRLTFPTRTCDSSDVTGNVYNQGNIFQVVIARLDHAQAAWGDLVSTGPYEPQAGADGIYNSDLKPCKGAKQYTPSVWMTWYVPGCPAKRFTDDAEWQTVDAAVQEAVDGTG